MKLLKKIGNFFKTLIKLSFRELISLILDGLCIVCEKPSLFINFFVVFYMVNPEMTTSQKGSALIIVGVILAFWLWLSGAIKRCMLDNVRPFARLLPRIFYRVRWLIILCVILWLYTIKVDLDQMFLYCGLCILTYSLSVIFRCVWLKVNGKDWKYEYDKRTTKF
jgi:hypothetical protein